MSTCILENDNTTDILIRQLKREVKSFYDDTTAKLLLHDGKIAELCNYVKTNLSNNIRELVDTMEASGELTEIITSVITQSINILDNAIVYYGEEVYTEKKHDDVSNNDYYITHIPKLDYKGNKIELRVGIANDNPALNTLESTIDFANRKNATLCINAGYFNINTNEPIGGIIQNGEVIRGIQPGTAKYNYITIDINGRLGYKPYNYSVNQMVAEGIKQAFCGTAILIDSGINQIQDDTSREPRQAIGQKRDGEFIILTCDGRTRNNEGMSYDDLIRIFNEYNVFNAYNLDGGGSTSTVLRGIKQNENIDSLYKDRAVSNFLYISKDVEISDSQIISMAFKEIGKLKQEIDKRIDNLIEIESGYLRLRGKEGFYLPGIECYTNGSNTRLGKIGITDLSTAIRSVFATLRNESGEDDTVFRASAEGLYNVNGLMANFLAYPRRTPEADCNIIGIPASAFNMYEADANSPGNGIGACILLHIPFTSDFNINIRQIAIPLNEQKAVKMRSCDSSGTWGDWYEFGVAKGNTNQRPTGCKAGAMYYDTTIRKPIWFTGAVWIDAAGNEV